jgi:hypothetical protein
MPPRDSSLMEDKMKPMDPARKNFGLIKHVKFGNSFEPNHKTLYKAFVTKLGDSVLVLRRDDGKCDILQFDNT